MLCKYWVQCDFVCFVVDADHKKFSVRHSLPSVTLADSLYHVSFCAILTIKIDTLGELRLPSFL
jgi:hypothetical protein